MEVNKINRAIVWSIAFLVIHGFLTIISSLLLPQKVVTFIGVVGGIYILIHAFLIKYNRDWLFINGLLSFVSVICLGVLIGKNLKFEEVISIGVAISAFDILSFTKYGKRTANAKAMSSIHFMSKLIVYGKGKGDELVPTCGIGDYFYYAIWISGIQAVSDFIYTYVVGSVLILFGSCIHYFLIIKLSKRDNYKGFPATVFPFLCISVLYIIIYMK
ncbi:MAG: hypothetical protein E7256_07595 [Lachnospiraceae bacterium]|nr:hypothetical protein [Lachnospiraceae bacterium]